jgi:RNA polymerase sigma-70 factor (ECF subfamily)
VSAFYSCTFEGNLNSTDNQDSLARSPIELREVGHAVWLQSVFERLQGPLVGYAYKLLGGDWDLAQDCVQEAFMRLCKEPRDRVESHVDAWLFKTCRNRAMDMHRQEARMTFQTDSPALTTLSSREIDPGQQAVSAEQNRRIDEEISKLPTLEHEVVLLRLGQGLSYKQIAEVTELSVSHVGVLLHQAMLRLRQAMAGENDAVTNVSNS